MKVCEICGDEIYTRHGENCCVDCIGKTHVQGNKAALKREREQVMRDIGLIKVHGAMGGVYWE